MQITNFEDLIPGKWYKDTSDSSFFRFVKHDTPDSDNKACVYYDQKFIDGEFKEYEGYWWLKIENITLAKYTPEIGDWVKLTKSTKNWGLGMDEYVGKIVQITGFKYDGIIDFKEQFEWGNWNWVYSDGHFTPCEAPVKDFILPEKWCIQCTLENSSVLSKWRNMGSCSIGSWILSKGHPKAENPTHDGYAIDCKPIDTLELTFEQFKQYVLKESYQCNHSQKSIIS